MRLPPLRRAVKRFLPTKLFARALLILLLPVILLQMLVGYMFYERHWDSVVRNMSSAVAGDVAMLLHEYEHFSATQDSTRALDEISDMGRQLSIKVRYIENPHAVIVTGGGRRLFPELYDNLDVRVRTPFMVEDDRRDNRVRVRFAGEHGVLEFDFSRKRLASSTTYIFMLWMAGFTALLMLIAVLFLRNQIRPIVQLARAAEQFGLGQEVANFSPRGASEIKRAASAFLIMAERIRRSVASRTEMLAGISHDLRTPLTRMKLEIEMGKIDMATRDAIEADIDEMRRMIDEYLDFARGDAGEPMELLDVGLLVTDVVEMYARQGQPVTLGHVESVEQMVRPQGMRRALTNLIDNALRYGKAARVDLELTLAYTRIKVTDRGPGIPEDEFEAVFKPFTRLETSRNVATGGVGLGLSIARDIALSHGGDITLENQRGKSGAIAGLEVTLRLPREVNV